GPIVDGATVDRQEPGAQTNPAIVGVPINLKLHAQVAGHVRLPEAKSVYAIRTMQRLANPKTRESGLETRFPSIWLRKCRPDLIIFGQRYGKTPDVISSLRNGDALIANRAINGE